MNCQNCGATDIPFDSTICVKNVHRDPVSLTLSEDFHPLDAPLGDLHAIAIRLATMGLYDLGIVVAKAHGDIQDWLVKNT